MPVGGLGLAYLLYNSGYWLPFGGGTPGPRFLVVTLPFLDQIGFTLKIRTVAGNLPRSCFQIRVPLFQSKSLEDCIDTFSCNFQPD